MSLREEVQLIVARIDEEHINHAEETALIINKVLDAAVGAIKHTKGVVTADDALYVINKLRQEK